MIIENEQRRVNDDGVPIVELSLAGSRFSGLQIRLPRTEEEGITIRAEEAGTDKAREFSFEEKDELYTGVIPTRGPDRRRDVDDDIQDVLQTIGFTVVDNE